VALLAWAFGSVGHVLVRHQRMIRPVYRKLLTQFLDTDERHDFYRGGSAAPEGTTDAVSRMFLAPIPGTPTQDRGRGGFGGGGGGGDGVGDRAPSPVSAEEESDDGGGWYIGRSPHQGNTKGEAMERLELG
jgi:hypothetical protein